MRLGYYSQNVTNQFDRGRIYITTICRKLLHSSNFKGFPNFKSTLMLILKLTQIQKELNPTVKVNLRNNYF